MSDVDRPFRALAGSDAPVAPDPAFAARLRARLQRKLLGVRSTPTPPGGPAMSQLTPYLVVRGARATIDWYTDAFGARLVRDPYVMDDDRIGHAELDVGGAQLFLADEHPELGLAAPEPGRVAVSMHLTVPDVDVVVARAAERGAVVERPPVDAPYGRTGVVVDPSGHRWMVQTPPAAAPQDAGTPVGEHGDVGYQTLYTPDVERTKAFFGDVLGWRYTGGEAQGGWEASGVVPMTGLMGGAPRPEVQLCFQVDDALDAVRRVRAAGGSAEEPADRPYGLLAECTDDQGMRFQLWQPR